MSGKSVAFEVPLMAGGGRSRGNHMQARWHARVQGASWTLPPPPLLLHLMNILICAVQSVRRRQNLSANYGTDTVRRPDDWTQASIQELNVHTGAVFGRDVLPVGLWKNW